jgi:hypothetical protein
MRLKSVARFFDRTVCSDAYSGSQLFKGQLDLHDASVRDSVTHERRTISTSPTISLPSRRCLQIEGYYYIIGTTTGDSFNGEVIRNYHVLHRANGMASVRTTGEVCSDAVGFTACSAMVWVKDDAYVAQSSDLNPQVNLYFAKGEPILVNHIVSLDSRLYIIRSTTVGSSGMLMCQADEIPEPSIEQGIMGVGEYDPITEQRINNNTPVKVLRLRWQSLFGFKNTLADKYKPGDMQVLTSKLVAPKAGTEFLLSDGIWHTVSVTDIGDSWLCHLTQSN